MRLYAGTSGFSYAEWKGSFYPAGLKNDAMLSHYAQKLDSVEINNTFYRMPKAEVLAGWAQKVPEGFVFVIKASQRITHRSRLHDTDDSVGYLWKNAQPLGAHLGPILFQLPPTLRRDEERLKRFVGALPQGMRAVMEMRHASWFDEPVFAVLRDHGVSLCFSDVDPTDDEDPGLDQPFVSTADFGYVRLRRAAYDEASLRAWISRIRQHSFREVFAFFKHEATAPGLALSTRALWAK